MNVQRIIQTLHNTNLALQRKQYYSAEQLRVIRKAKAKANRELKKMIKP